jgi:ectoine hydroxylase-related dioxygenase (phytanoyl-CoA dioxygenase family)
MAVRFGPQHDGGVTRLSDDDLRQFARDGYLLLPGVVPETLLAEADREIDGLISEASPHEGDGGAGTNLWFPPRDRLPRCDAALRESPALRIAEELVAPLALDHAFDHIQVATTVPPYDHVPGGPHIDGHGPGQDPPESFTMLAAILLTDQTTRQSGNLWVWPGSHLDHQRLFVEHGTRALQPTGGHSTLLQPPLELQPAVPVIGGRGDLLLAHFMLGHNKGGNTAAQVRRTIYYRLAAPGHASRWESTFLDPWTEYLPVREALGATR